MITPYLILWSHAAPESGAIDLPEKPSFERLAEFLIPLLNADFERVKVLADFRGGNDFIPLDMFVDERGGPKRLPRNEAATTLYRRANLMGRTPCAPVRDPEHLAFISGTAILFSRRVWF